MKRIDLTEGELNALAQLMDAGVKALGLNAVDAASVLKRRIEEAQDIPDEPVPEVE